MGRLREYRERFAEAMSLSGKQEHEIAEALKVSYQAVKKVMNGTTKMLKADNNVAAAKLMQVDSEWLATGDGDPRGPKVWPLSAELLAAINSADAVQRQRVENAARVSLDMPPLPPPTVAPQLTLSEAEALPAIGGRRAKKQTGDGPGHDATSGSGAREPQA